MNTKASNKSFISTFIGLKIVLKLEDYFSREGIVVIEWADRWPGKLPENNIHVEFKMIDEHTRELEFFGNNYRAKKIIGALKEKVGRNLTQL
jgi:hypothetical protein